MPARVTLRILGGPTKRTTLLFEEHDTAVVGRGKDCTARLPDDDVAVSRHHFLLEVAPPLVRLRDLGSRHGTYVNGRKYGGRREGERAQDAAARSFPEVDLKDGDEIRVGGTRLAVEIRGDALGVGPAGGCDRCGRPAPGPEGRPEAPRLCAECRGAAPPPTLPGYELLHRLGVGGMGEVYLARRLRDSAWVAMKMMLARVSVKETSRTRFLRESSIVEQLAHPNIVAFYERGSDSQAFHFAMEFCPLGSLTAYLRGRGGRLPPREARDIALQLLDGLSYAHVTDVEVELEGGARVSNRGVVHRDIKPANVLLTGSSRRPFAKLSDFGLAKCFETAGLSGCTVTGDAGGALPYMPREQLLDFKHLQPVSDVWSAAATLYEMVAGTTPREMPADRDPLQVILGGGFVPLRRRDPGIPAAFAEVVDRALDDDVTNRYPTASAFRDALAAVAL